MLTQPLTLSDVSLIAPSLAAYPFKPYRHYRAYSRKAQNAILQAEVTSALQLAPHLGFRAGDEEHHALVIARPLAWDSDFFGVRMARIDYLITGPGAAPHLAFALDATLDACREAAIPHVTARVDVEDVGAVDLLERRGFRLMDALVTYRIRPPKLDVSAGLSTDLSAVARSAKVEARSAKAEARSGKTDAREVGVIRDFDVRDTDPVMEIAREAFAGYVGRFQHDPHVRADRAEQFYLEWTRKGLSGEMADKLFVSVNSEDTVIGFLFFRRREPASTAGGVPIYGGGLGACRRDSPGAYAGLIRAGARWAEDQGSVAECQTQNYNFPVIRVYEAAGGTYVRAEYTLHAWLGA